MAYVARTQFRQEARVLSEYLIDTPPAKSHIELYSRVVSKRGSDPLFEKAKQHTRLLPYIDAYDAFFRPRSELRSRLYLMFSILEASTHDIDKFLPRQRSRVFVAIALLVGLRAIWRLMAGVVIVKLGKF